MVDNIDVTPGTGKTVATEELAGFQVQRVKPVIGQFGVDGGDIYEANPMPVISTTANAKLDSIIAAISSTNSKLDTISGNTGVGNVNLVATLVTTSGGSYTTGQVVGGVQTLTGATRTNGGSGIIQFCSVDKKQSVTSAYDVYFFHTQPVGTYTDNTTFALSVSDIPSKIGVAQCVSGISNGTPQSYQATNVGLPFKLSSGSSLYALPVVRGSETYTSTSAVILSVAIMQE